MKKIIASVISVGLLGSSVLAEDIVTKKDKKFINFEFSTLAYGSAGSSTTLSGNAFVLSFNLDDKIKVGVLQENLGITLKNDGATATGSMQVNAINLDYQIADKLSTGINVGNVTIPTSLTATGTTPKTATIAASSVPLSEIYVKGTYIIGSKGALNASIGYRMVSIADSAAVSATDGVDFDNMNGIIAKVGFSVGF